MSSSGSNVRSSPDGGGEGGDPVRDTAVVVGDDSRLIGAAARSERSGAEADVELRAKCGSVESDDGHSPVGRGLRPAEGGVNSSVGENDALDTIAGRTGGDEEERVSPPGERIGGSGEAGIEGRNGRRIECRKDAVGDGFEDRRENFEDGEAEADLRCGFAGLTLSVAVEVGGQGEEDIDDVVHVSDGRRFSIDLRAGDARKVN